MKKYRHSLFLRWELASGFNIILLSILVIIFAGCENLTEPIAQKEARSVFIMLQAGEHQQNIFIYKGLNTSEKIPSDGRKIYLDKYFDTEAKIDVYVNGKHYTDYTINDSISYNGPFSVRDKYYRSVDFIKLKAGDTCSVDIITADKNISGTTIIPSEFSIVYPQIDQVIDYLLLAKNGLAIKWTCCKEAACYFVNVNNERTVIFNGDTIKTVNNYDFVTTNLEYKMKAEEITRGKYKVQITAYDENYYDYAYGKVYSSGINGAYGYIASSNSIACYFTVK